MASRKSFPKRERVRIFELNDGRCHICGEKIHVGAAWDLEHIIPWELTRDDTDENVKPAHKSCHKSKTREDVRAIRKADRQKASHIGAKPKGRGWNEKWKKKLDGTVVPR